MAIISLSLIASYLIYGASLANCQPIFSFKIKHYGDATADVYFPFTIAYPQRYTLLSFTVIRGMGMFREPGVSQAFLNAALICCGLLWRGWSAHFRAAIIFLGIVLTMSTAGIINLMISIPLYAICVYGKKAIVPVFIATLFLMPAFAFITNMESVGLHDKLSGESGEDRLNAFAEFQRLWSDAGIWGLSGIGRYKTESTAGTLLIYYLNNGLIGLVASMAPIIYFLTKSHLGKALLVLVPPSISMLTSQPLWGTVPFVVLVALAQKLSLETTTSNSSSD